MTLRPFLLTVPPPRHRSTARGRSVSRRVEGLQVSIKFDRETIVFGLALLLFAVFSFALSGFFTTGNLLNLVRNVSVLGILGVGMGIVIIGRGIDLAMVSNMAISIAWSVKLMEQGTSVANRPGLRLRVRAVDVRHQWRPRGLR